MLIAELKQVDDIKAQATASTVVISCEGCKEVYFPESEVNSLIGKLKASGKLAQVVRTDYICSPESLTVQTRKHLDKINAAESIIVFSCGVGIQSVSEKFEGTPIFAGCDTIPLPGCQGVTPLTVDCDQCGECYLNLTGGICPIALCSKSLVNGQCGGCKEGKCEVSSEMDCVWERIYRRLEKLELLENMNYPTKIRNY